MTRDRPSWTTGEEFRPPPLAYIEYAETRMELYREIKQAWLEANREVDGAAAADPLYPRAPEWQKFTDESEWTRWMENVAGVHQRIRQVQLKSTERQRAAWEKHQAAAAAATA